MRRLRCPAAERDSRRGSPSRATTSVETCSSEVEHAVGQRTAAGPTGERRGSTPHAAARVRRRGRFTAPGGAAGHGSTAITAEPVRPNTSGSYISSTWVGAVRNVPEVVARAT